MSKAPGKSNEHGKLIAAAARAALAPLGCRRVGRSRTWISDEGFWLIVIEFQPSGWEKGTYLNVGAMWLWQDFRGFCFHHGYREDDFTPFETAEQFIPNVERKARRAAERVQELRAEFRSVGDVKRLLLKLASRNDGRLYDAAVACGLTGEPELARDLFQRHDASVARFSWGPKRIAESLALAGVLHDRAKFRDAVIDVIEASRRLKGLQSDRERIAASFALEPPG
ncbi:MAG: hypothetical protein JOZ84_07780 [Methylobacteriaceae bacterium]|nr:hypothetical protein [Methylobacteriaceae bacterium]MBV9394294.1 hypothetical protein [Methylobacteriaceae bacterium]